MTYLPDLSPFESEDETVSIGWLSERHTFPRGEVPDEFVSRLREFSENYPLPYATLGYHACEFCGRFLGGGEVRVLGARRAYAAPSLVHHYVTRHGYRPPDEFVDAVLESPLPSSEEYRGQFGELAKHVFPDQGKDLRWSWNGRPRWWQLWKWWGAG